MVSCQGDWAALPVALSRPIGVAVSSGLKTSTLHLIPAARLRRMSATAARVARSGSTPLRRSASRFPPLRGQTRRRTPQALDPDRLASWPVLRCAYDPPCSGVHHFRGGHWRRPRSGPRPPRSLGRTLPVSQAEFPAGNPLTDRDHPPQPVTPRPRTGSHRSRAAPSASPSWRPGPVRRFLSAPRGYRSVIMCADRFQKSRTWAGSSKS
jgi:hypothetical protein